MSTTKKTPLDHSEIPSALANYLGVRRTMTLRRIMRQTGHKSIEMVLRYVRQAQAFTDNAALALGL